MKHTQYTTRRVLTIATLALAACSAEQAEEEVSFRGYTATATLGGGGGGGAAICEPDEVFDVNERRSLFETNEDALSGFSLHEVLSAIGDTVSSSDPAILHDQLMDSFAAGPGVTSGPHCDDSVAFDGSDGLNGFPLQCPRAESLQVGNMDDWFPIAAVNRFDLAPSDGSNCGEARLVFANREPIGPGRAFVIFEAQVPNPDPACGINACAPVQEFWAELSHIDDPLERADRLRGAFLTGDTELADADFRPFVSASAFTFGAGQIRTNTFNQGPWTLREFKTAGNLFTGVELVQVPVAANTFGPLWNDSVSIPGSALCRSAILDSVGALMNDDPNLMGLSVPASCLAGESPASSISTYPQHLVAGSAFEAAIANEINLVNPLSTLTPAHIARRALFGGACIGCHQQSNFGSNADLGAGVSAPPSLGFVHTHESAQEACGDGTMNCFQISPALKDSFLPHRKGVMDTYLNGGPCCETPSGGFGGGGLHPIDREPRLVPFTEGPGPGGNTLDPRDGERQNRPAIPGGPAGRPAAPQTQQGRQAAATPAVQSGLPELPERPRSAAELDALIDLEEQSKGARPALTVGGQPSRRAH